MSEARTVTDDMLLTAARTLAAAVSTDSLRDGTLFPPINELRAIARAVAIAVAGPGSEPAVDAAMWWPRYVPYLPERTNDRRRRGTDQGPATRHGGIRVYCLVLLDAVLGGHLLIRELVNRLARQCLDQILKAFDQGLDRGVGRALDRVFEHAPRCRATETKVACRVDRRDRDLRQDLIQTPMGLIVAQSGADLPLQARARINRRPHAIPLTLKLAHHV